MKGPVHMVPCHGVALQINVAASKQPSKNGTIEKPCMLNREFDWRRGGLVVSALDFRSRGRWFEPGHCRRVVSLDKKLYSTLSLFTQVYKWVSAIIMLGVTLRWTSIPTRGE